MDTKLYGLMITKDDETVFNDWCREQLSLYDAVICLDGSTSNSAELNSKKYKNLIYLHERDFNIPHKTDHGLRKIVHDEICKRFGKESWIMCCHADEFCYHDPRKIVEMADRLKYKAVSWYSLQFYPHSSEMAQWDTNLPIYLNSRYYHWDFKGSGYPVLEDRLYKNDRRIYWDGVTHASTRPKGVRLVAPFHPILLHYKVCNIDLQYYESTDSITRYRTHWTDCDKRTGFPHPTFSKQDLFVERVLNYNTCSRFDGTIPHKWNIGDKYKPT